ncbi:MAG: hypothetical protein WKF92_07330 [Pyrinomonadaceae bacterium]
MDKTSKTELQRAFLIQGLPEPLTRASSHIQLFDNYITNTRIRLRSVRNPNSREWNRILQQRIPAGENEISVLKIAEIYLNDEEYAQFRIFEGTEIRKNRYFHEYGGKVFALDVYLGSLWGLNMARIEFADLDEMREFEPPPSLIAEVTNDPFFAGETLVSKTFAEVEAEVLRLGVLYKGAEGEIRTYM